MFYKKLITGLCLSLCGCFTTHLDTYKSTPGLDTLVASAQHSLHFRVLNPAPESSRGFQFMLGVLPIARVFTEDLEAIVASRLQFHAGRAGYGLISSGNAPTDRPRLIVTISEATINGYDLLFIRRPSAFMVLEGTLVDQSGVVNRCAESGSYSELSKFAFADDLTRALESAADNAALRLTKCLGISANLAAQDIAAESR